MNEDYIDLYEDQDDTDGYIFTIDDLRQTNPEIFDNLPFDTDE